VPNRKLPRHPPTFTKLAAITVALVAVLFGANYSSLSAINAEPPAANSHTFLLTTDTGPVRYSSGTGPITWLLEPNGITESGSTLFKETLMWQEIFNDLQTQTGYHFNQIASEGSAKIRISYALGVTDPSAPEVGQIPGLGGFTDFTWDGTTWIANSSRIILNSYDLRRYKKMTGLRAWTAMHELGHALGLGHVADPTQIMMPCYNPLFPLGAYGLGDLAGLQTLSQ
jgi:hypothetical protein